MNKIIAFLILLFFYQQISNWWVFGIDLGDLFGTGTATYNTVIATLAIYGSFSHFNGFKVFYCLIWYEYFGFNLWSFDLWQSHNFPFRATFFEANFILISLLLILIPLYLWKDRERPIFPFFGK